MSDNFGPALKLVLVHEGGWSDHPADPGGATMKGVTQAVYDAYRAARGSPPRSVRSITTAELQAIYRRQYWDLVHGDDLPRGVDYAVFDYAVNSGVKRAVMDLQKTLKCAADGIVGVRTMEALVDADPVAVVDGLCDRRLAFVKSLRTWKTFGKGWSARIAGVRRAAKDMAAHGGVAQVVGFLTPTTAQAKGVKAPESNQAALKTADGQGLTSVTVGGAGTKAMEVADQVKPHFGETTIGRLAVATFFVLMVVGVALLAYGMLRRAKEKGGLSGLISDFIRS